MTKIFASKKLFVGAALLLTSLFASTSHASIYIEPYVGYEFGHLDVDEDVTAPVAISINSNLTSSGADFGAKLGYSFLLVAVGVDYMGGSTSSKYQGTSTTYTNSDIGAFVNVALPLIKVSATYFFSDQGKTSNGTLKGSGFKIGAGFTGLPFIAINVDYLNIDYTKVTGSTDTFSSFDAKRNGVMLSVSLPLNLL
jgi:hypothetical protein